MAWVLSTQLQKDLLGGSIEITDKLTGSDIAFESNKIKAPDGLDIFKPNESVLVIGSASNENKLARVKTSSATELEFADNTFTAEAAGTEVVLVAYKNGCIKDLFKNSVLVLFTGVRPANADAAETGTKVCELTVNGNLFTEGQPENGINLRLVVDNGIVSLKRATKLDDPAAPEILQGIGLANGTAGWGRWYLNDKVIGSSTIASRMDGVVTTAVGGDIVMSNGRDIAVGAPVSVTDIAIKIQGA